jgi:hypothetical protein
MNIGPGLLLSLAFLVALIVLMAVVLRFFMSVFRSEPGELACTWKFRTVIYLLMAIAVPLWPLTFPLFAFFAYRSYREGLPSVWPGIRV